MLKLPAGALASILVASLHEKSLQRKSNDKNVMMLGKERTSTKRWRPSLPSRHHGFRKHICIAEYPDGSQQYMSVKNAIKKELTIK